MVECRVCGRGRGNGNEYQVQSCLECGNLENIDDSLVAMMNSHPTYQRDVVFIVQGTRFPALRALVSAASPVFHAMLTNGMRETGKYEIEIESVNKPSWSMAISFIHTGKVEVKSKEAACSLLLLANQYQISALQDIIEAYFCHHFRSIYQDRVFQLLPFHIVGRLSRSKTLKLVSELDLLVAIMFWANISIHKNSSDVDEGIIGSTDDEDMKQEEAKILLQNLRVANMEPWEISVAMKYPFIRNCTEIVASFTNHLLKLSGRKIANPIGYYPIYRYQLPWCSRRYQFMFKVEELKTRTGDWNCRDPLYSPWNTDKITGRTWQLKVYLQGTQDASEYVSVYLKLDLKCLSYTPEKIQIFLLKKKAKEEPKMFELNNRRFEPGAPGIGCMNFISKQLLYRKESEYLSDQPVSLSFGVNIFYGHMSS